MPSLLLFQPLLQRLHELLEAAERFDQLFLLVGQVFFGEPAQPFLGQVGDVDMPFAGHGLQPLEHVREDLVEAVDVPFVLHECGARQVVEPLDVVLDQPRIHAFEQRKIFPQRDGDLRSLEFEEEGQEHGRQLRWYLMKGVSLPIRS